MTGSGCPADAGDGAARERGPHGDRWIVAPDEASRPSSPPDVVRLDRIDEARRLLRLRSRTTQAGFTAERIPRGMFRRRPILIDDGAEHDEHRRQLTRFLAPRVLAERHGAFIEEAAREAVDGARASGGCLVDELALRFSVRVASRIVGLTERPVERLSRRLVAFFDQPPVDHTRPDHGRTRRQWMLAARNALGPLAAFYLADVRPAIRARRAHPRDDIVSHLLEHGYRPGEILMECLTYGTAGMVTTREFIAVALWHLLEDDPLRARFLRAASAERSAILHELIRLEPPVGHLYRRVHGDDADPADAVDLDERDRTAGTGAEPRRSCPAGALVDVDVRAANLDPAAFGDAPDRIRADRALPASERAGLSFGDGPHRCPGEPLAMLETDALLLALLRAGAEIEHPPVIEWDTLIEGYRLRGFTLRFPALDRDQDQDQLQDARGPEAAGAGA